MAAPFTPGNRYNLACVIGPTASGKTQLAVSLAHRIGGEIISADSRQVYRHMDIGTGKDLNEYVVDGVPVPCHLVDIVEPGYKYNVYEYQRDFYRVFDEVQHRGHFPVMCGGSGLYVEAVLEGYQLLSVPPDPELRTRLEKHSLAELADILASYKFLHNNSDTETKIRAIRAIEIEEYYRTHPEIEQQFPQLKPLIVGVNIDRDARRERITRRLKARLDEGMVDEARRLMQMGLSAEDLIYYGLEYKYLALFLTGQLSESDMFDQLNTAIHQFAKRQMTWFRKMERSGIDILWLDAFEPIEQRVDKIVTLLQA
ncbi:tRNA dimethylallyltransferase [Breznakibacter xylanolyticus]|uniref:tRNA dimethylallyltransferase n=1 Tax=Breznakibacter xylanolyticus TaxID=990 RepID=A0A2W7P1F5_9BACT|nr:tRNA (adenosine(37)-N6)-dimethylallyltransferase MiaA [Breznakibacter xylanolyticus]PZX17282.1 tRNA dimethylallyltransferase [Breznakibacter xylanolyticus]